MEITPALPSEADVLTSIALTAKRHWGYPERWITLWIDTLTISPDTMRRQHTFAARRGSSVLGFAALARDGDILRLEHLWVLPAEMGRGIGRALFHQAQKCAPGLGFATFEVESDPNAAGFYDRMGAERLRTNRRMLGGQVRELPVFRVTASRLGAAD